MTSGLMKVSTQQKCPDAETLAAFDSGKLAESEFKAVAEHIEVCRECLSQLEQANSINRRAVVHAPSRAAGNGAGLPHSVTQTSSAPPRSVARVPT